MNTGKLIRTLTPFIMLFSLLGFLAWELFYAKPQEQPSALIGQDLPVFTLPNLFPEQPTLTSDALKQGVILLNVWASWCHACAIEHSMLMKIRNEYHIPIVGIVYKDNPESARRALQEGGNPYVRVGSDSSGDVAIDLGVYGTPETFILRQGKIIYRHIGILDEQSFVTKLYPVIRQNGG